MRGLNGRRLSIVAIVLAGTALYFEKDQISASVQMSSPVQACNQAIEHRDDQKAEKAALTALGYQISGRGCSLVSTSGLQVQTDEESHRCSVQGMLVLKNPNVPPDASYQYQAGRDQIMPGSWVFQCNFRKTDQGYGLTHLDLSSGPGDPHTLVDAQEPVAYYTP